MSRANVMQPDRPPLPTANQQRAIIANICKQRGIAIAKVGNCYRLRNGLVDITVTDLANVNVRDLDNPSMNWVANEFA